MRTRLPVVALALMIASCSGGAANNTTTSTSQAPASTSQATTSTSQATTTSVDDRPRSPINGLPVDDPETLQRRVLGVKVDNHWNARPQSGILEADAVFEILVEGGLTRFMAVFHSSDSELVGPIRSGRPSDAALIRPLDAALAISGGQPWVRAGIQELGVPYLSDTRPGMFRVSDRPAPHNLYGNTLELRELADERDIPDEPPATSLWEFGENIDGDEEASHATFTFSNSTTVEWFWDGATYYRSIDGIESSWLTPEGEVERIHSDVLIALVGEQYTASGSSGSSVPATRTVGTGPAYIFHNGEVAEGTWEREDATQPFSLTDSDGQTLTVPAGFPWISVIPDRGEVAWDNPPVTTTTTTPSTVDG